MNARQVFLRYGPWLAGGMAVLVVIGAAGRESTAARPLEAGYSVVTVNTAGQDDAVAGYTPVQMHEPLSRQFQPTKDETQDEVPDRYRQPDNRDDMAIRQVQAAMFQEEAPGNDKKRERKKNDMFSSLRDKDAGSLDKDRESDADDSLGWGWLADGVGEGQGRVNVRSSERRTPSPLESSLRKELFPEETSGWSEPAGRSKGGSGFNWRSLREEQAP
jgi:hypothetical protein